MKHQDFNPVIFRKPPTSSKLSRTHFEVNPIDKLANADDCGRHTSVGLALASRLQSARLLKGFKTQKELANRLNLPVNLINKYETGSALPDNKTMQKIRSILGKLN